MSNVKKVVEVMMDEDGCVEVSVSNLGEYKWFNYLMMDGGLVDVVEEGEVVVKFDEYKKILDENVWYNDDVNWVEIKEKFVKEVEKVVEELGDVMMWVKMWGIESDFNMSIVVSNFE